MDGVRLLLADGHWLVRAGLRVLLGRWPGCEVVGEAENGSDAVTLAATLHPDVVLLDLDIPGIGGAAAARQITRACPNARVLMLTDGVDERALLPALRAGANGFVPKDVSEERMLDAIRRVADGEVVIGPHATELLVEAFRAAPLAECARDRVARLSEREREVLTLVARGYTPTEISEQLRVSRKTVDTYRVRLMQKLELTRKWQLVEIALQSSLMEVS